MIEQKLESMITECPHCQTRFRVTDLQLKAAAGRVRCGSCLNVFQGARHMVPAHVPEPAPPRRTATVRHLYGGHEEQPPRAEPDEPAETTCVDDSPGSPTSPENDGKAEPESSESAIAAGDGPSMEVPKSLKKLSAVEAQGLALYAEPPRRRWWAPLAAAAGVLLVGSQVLWLQFDTWARDPQVRPLYAMACSVVGCDLPVMRDVDSLLAKNLVVRRDPDQSDALLVNAIIVNQAAFAQPFPVLELSFTALNGSPVKEERFEPGTYLAGEMAGATDMPPRTPVHIELTVAHPGEMAVNYSLSFR
jgi:predicted Zn finger-like uncharacterized protein